MENFFGSNPKKNKGLKFSKNFFQMTVLLSRQKFPQNDCFVLKTKIPPNRLSIWGEIFQKNNNSLSPHLLSQVKHNMIKKEFDFFGPINFNYACLAKDCKAPTRSRHSAFLELRSFTISSMLGSSEVGCKSRALAPNIFSHT
jgi:hypothetical protein